MRRDVYLIGLVGCGLAAGLASWALANLLDPVFWLRMSSARWGDAVPGLAILLSLGWLLFLPGWAWLTRRAGGTIYLALAPALAAVSIFAVAFLTVGPSVEQVAPSPEAAFASVERIMQDVDKSWFDAWAFERARLAAAGLLALSCILALVATVGRLR